MNCIDRIFFLPSVWYGSKEGEESWGASVGFVSLDRNPNNLNELVSKLDWFQFTEEQLKHFGLEFLKWADLVRQKKASVTNAKVEVDAKS